MHCTTVKVSICHRKTTRKIFYIVAFSEDLSLGAIGNFARLNVGLVRAHKEAKILGMGTIHYLSWFIENVARTKLSEFRRASR